MKSNDTKSFAVVTITTAEFPPRVCVSPFWEVGEECVMACVVDTAALHAETLGTGMIDTTVREIAC